MAVGDSPPWRKTGSQRKSLGLVMVVGGRMVGRASSRRSCEAESRER